MGVDLLLYALQLHTGFTFNQSHFFPNILLIQVQIKTNNFILQSRQTKPILCVQPVMK